MTKITTIVLAAGAAHRMGDGSKRPKPYLKLGGEPLLLWAMRGFADYGAIQPVIRLGDQAYYQEVAERALAQSIDDLRPAAIGGQSRAASVLAGLVALADQPPDIVIIHDGARPFVPPDLVKNLLQALNEGYVGAAPALWLSDSLKKVEGDQVKSFHYENLARVQTPQAFDYQALIKAFQSATLHESDELAVLEHINAKVKLVAGDHRNIKLTYPDDWDSLFSLWKSSLWESSLWKKTGTRTGTRTWSGIGVDAHHWSDGDYIMLGGVQIAHDKALAAHSDGDVVLHALCDAILGALVEGDLGTHFPNTRKWQNQPSKIFLEKTLEKVKQAGLKLIHSDVTIICTTPMIAPHRDNIRQKLAELLTLDISKVSVKATTNDGMGLIGNNEGIAATAIVSLEAL